MFVGVLFLLMCVLVLVCSSRCLLVFESVLCR